MAQRNAFLDRLQAKADAKAEFKSNAHVEIDTMAMLLAAHARLQAGPGRAPGLVNDFLAYKVEIADAILKEYREDKSKKKEIVIVRRDLARSLKEILGQEGWAKWHTLFPFLQEYWEWEAGL
jgi:hypothetical protein